MIFLFVTVLVIAVLAYAGVELRAAYGGRALVKLLIVTVAYFFVKEWLQANNLLLHHYYATNNRLWLHLLGVPPFVVFGHVFVVVMTWQLAIQYIDRLGLRAHPILLPALTWYLTSAFSMLMESTGVVGHWWSWNMPSWWFYPNLLGAPLIDLPWDRPITQAWGYFISSYWLVLLATDLPRKWTLARGLSLLLGLTVVLELARLTWFRAAWSIAMPALPVVGVVLRRPLGLPTDSTLMRERRLGAAVPLGLGAMVAVSVTQIVVASKWLALVSLFPLAALVLGAFRPRKAWIGIVASGAVVGVGYWLNNGNVLLAGWLVLRCGLFLSVLVAAERWRSRRPTPEQSEPHGNLVSHGAS